MSWISNVANMEKTRNANRLLVGKPEGQRPCLKAYAQKGRY
jgi:hypothetical protein